MFRQVSTRYIITYIFNMAKMVKYEKYERD